MPNDLEPKTIAELVSHDSLEMPKYQFKIPSYQRGYRWKKEQIKALIDDIWEFAENQTKEEFYCLQPLVVKHGETEEWEVIDGQQRLTTIYLILQYMKHSELFTLEYSTRGETEAALKNLPSEGGSDNDTIDVFHINDARNTISECFKSSDPDSIDKEKWKECFLTKTKVIWYKPEGLEEKEGNKESIKIFSRLNVGKIPLTNSELIRALFILKTKGKPPSELNEYKIASEWDFIEQQLHNEAFWTFVTLGKPFNKDYPNHIELLFDLIEEKQRGSSKSHTTYSTFEMYSDWLSEIPKNIRTDNISDVPHLWQEIKNLYYRFHEWFIDDSLYHRIGFIRHQGMETLKELLGWANENKQSMLTEKTKGVISCEIGEIKNLSYGDGKIKAALLLHNIATYERQNERFPFGKFIVIDWDIEHIHASADQVPKERRKEFMRQWVEFFINLYSKDKEEVRELEKAKEKYVEEEKKNSAPENLDSLFGAFKDVYTEFSAKISSIATDANGSEIPSDLSENSLSNLALLDSKTNRSFKDNPFPEKREEILKRESQGVFIPHATRNVFTKCYSIHEEQNNEPENKKGKQGERIVALDLWGAMDRKCYLTNLITTIDCFLKSE